MSETGRTQDQVSLAERGPGYDPGGSRSLKGALNALLESGRHWRSLVETAPSFIFMMDTEGTILFSNRLVDGIPPESVYGHKGWEFVPGEYQEAVKQTIAAVIDSGEAQTIEHPAVGPNRTHAWYTSRIGPVLVDGVVVAVTAVTSDSTEKRDLEESQRLSDARLRAIVTAVSDVILMFDRDGTYLEVLAAPSGSPILAAPPEQLIGRRIGDFYPGPQTDYFLQMVTETIATGTRRYIKAPYEYAGGSFVLETHLVPLRLPDGTDVAVTATRDVTARARLEEELEELREEAENRAAAKFRRGSRYGLSFREATVLQLVAGGQSDREIAETLNIARSTVNKHVGNILSKMDVSRRAEAAAKAVRERII